MKQAITALLRRLGLMCSGEAIATLDAYMAGEGDLYN
jgi:hypothetical protein